MNEKTNPQSILDQQIDTAMNDAALCLLLANEIDKKPDHNGKGDTLTAHALRKLADRLVDDELDDTPTVPVRILVAIDETGEWRSYGNSAVTDPKEWIILDDLGVEFTYRWVEADIPLPPVAPIIPGKVS